jgi:deoxyribodipyrimidine photo-lyase
MSNASTLVWFRRDLRAYDHTALHEALKTSAKVYCAFVFDKEILDALPHAADRRVEFIWHAITELKQSLTDMGGDLWVCHAKAEEAIPLMAKALGVNRVMVNHDYEPAAVARDASVAAQLAQAGIGLSSFKDQVVFEKSEVLTLSGGTFSVFTPYKNAWIKRLKNTDLEERSVSELASTLAKPDAAQHQLALTALGQNSLDIPSLEAMGFATTNLLTLNIGMGESGGKKALDDFLGRMDRYKNDRDFPAVKGVSYLSVHMRFGTLSVRHAARSAWEMYSATQSEGALGWLNELIWRDFYFQILHHHPRVVAKAFKADYDLIEWEQGDAATGLFNAWCEGKTGYPLVDAAMRQLNTTGFMHNRLRMVVASFLTKDLGLDWRWGEKYFAEQLNDFDLSANNGGWQWAASSGCDAQPYFRIFNPVSQSEKFDAEGKFIRKYCPELSALNKKQIHAPWEVPALELSMANIQLGKSYPRPCVDHAHARAKTLLRYAVVKKATVGEQETT